MTIIPEIDGSYTARCDGCAWSITVGSEPFAEEMGEQHRGFHPAVPVSPERVAELVAEKTRGWKAVEERVRAAHLHSRACTDASCPGEGFPTRDELISARRSRHGERLVPGEKPASNEVPI